MKPIDRLTQQECAVLSLLMKGQRNARIADELCISIRTVENHLHHIFQKLGVSSRMEAAIFALGTGSLSNVEMSGTTHDLRSDHPYNEGIN